MLSVEESAFKRSLNDRIRGIWTKGKWPPLMVVVEKTVSSVNNATLQADKAIQIDNTTNLFDVFAVYTENPYENIQASQIEYRLIGDYMVLPTRTSEGSVFILGTKVPSDDYGNTALDIPQFMDRMLLAYCLADYYRADGQNDKALSEEQRAEEYFAQEIDRFERMESQNFITINQYPTIGSSVLVKQTTI